MLNILVAISLRTSLLCLVGFTFVWFLRQSSPVLRHRIWAGIVSGSLILPALLFIIPVIYLPVETSPPVVTQPVLPLESDAEITTTHASQMDNATRPDMNVVAPTPRPAASAQSSQPELSKQPIPQIIAARHINMEIALIALWFCGVLWMVARGIRQVGMLGRLARSSHVLTDPTWLELRDDLASRIGLRRQVKLLQSDRIDVPFAWGLWEPYILLPASRSQWSGDWRQMILLHELTHIHRRDTALNCLAWLARTVYWFNPLIWFACQRLSVEAEHATDARVLAGTVNRIHYAQLLVDFARHLSPDFVAGGTAMISKSTLKARVQNILKSPEQNSVSAKPRQWFVVFILALFITLIGGVQVVGVTAQSNEITLTVTLIEGMEYLEDSRVFVQFEEANPDIRTNVVYQPLNTAFLPSAVGQIESHLDRVDDYTISGDVLIASAGASLPPEVSLEATQAGYYLNLAPLIQTDASFDPSLFYPAAWNSVNWEGGTWLLPLAIQIYTVIYDSQAFDTASLAYPDTNWRIEDYINAIQALTMQDTSGVTAPGFIGYNRSDHALVYSFLGQGVTDDTSGSIQPRFTDPQILTAAEQWGQLLTTGAIYNPLYTYPDDFTPTTIPFTTDRLQGTVFADDATTLMPGSSAGIAVSGFAVSSRTQYPDAAYQLALYLSNDVRVADALVTSFSMTAKARPTYNERDGSEDAPFSLGTLSTDNQALLELAIENAIPVSELLLFDYFLSGLQQAINTSGDVQAALQAAQLLAQDNLQFASERRVEIAGSVITSTRDVELQPGEIALRFGLDTTTNVADSGAWERFLTEFVEADPEVGEVILDSRSISIDRAVETYDCFYLPFNAVSVADRNMLINLDPLLSADPAFRQDDFWPGIFEQVERDNQTWAYPIDMYPSLIWYDERLFSETFVSGQTIQEFYTTLDAQFVQNNDAPVMVASNLGPTLLMLLAADGGLPIDFRQNPPVIDFTGQLASIQRVLDLAKDGVIHYEPLTSLTGLDAPSMPPIQVRPWGVPTFDTGGYIPALFPRGNAYTPIAFELGTAYISRLAVNPEACYRLISRVSQRPDLFTGIPIRQASEATQAGDFQTFVPELDMMLDNPDTVVFPYRVRGNASRDVILSYWLYRAFDRYVLDDANLDAEMIEAERFSQEYLSCTDALPAYDPAIQSSRERTRQYVECALQVDPTSQEYFSFGNG